MNEVQNAIEKLEFLKEDINKWYHKYSFEMIENKITEVIKILKKEKQ